MMTASPDDAWLRHTVRKQRIIATNGSNIILSVAKNIISPIGDASFKSGGTMKRKIHGELLSREHGIYKKLYDLQMEALKNAGIVE